jgi:hypothetical protein
MCARSDAHPRLTLSLRKERKQENWSHSDESLRRGDVWWYEFWFAGRRIRETSKSPSKTVAKGAEQKRKREQEAGL